MLAAALWMSNFGIIRSCKENLRIVALPGELPPLSSCGVARIQLQRVAVGDTP